MKRENKRPSSVDIAVGNQVRRARVMLGWSQSKLGEAVGVSFQQIQKYEVGSAAIRVSRLMQFSEALGVPVSFFLKDPEGMAISSEIFAEGQAATQSAELINAFLAIEDWRVRSKIVELLEIMALTGLSADE